MKWFQIFLRIEKDGKKIKLDIEKKKKYFLFCFAHTIFMCVLIVSMLLAVGSKWTKLFLFPYFLFYSLIPFYSSIYFRSTSTCVCNSHETMCVWEFSLTPKNQEEKKKINKNDKERGKTRRLSKNGKVLTLFSFIDAVIVTFGFCWRCFGTFNWILFYFFYF